MTVYYITCEDTGTVKIGYAADPLSRLSKMQSDNASPLELVASEPGDELREAEIHALFAEDRVRGEWFTLSDRIRAHIATVSPFVRPARRPSVQSMIIRATGVSRSYATQAVSEKYPNQSITIPMAVAVFRDFGERIGPLSDATDHEIDILEKFCGRLTKHAPESVAA